MGSLVRWLFGIPFAALVTIGLFVFMTVIIAGEFEAKEKSAAANFDINPTVEDIKVVRTETKVKQIRKVVTPPPPPQIARQQAAVPSVPIAALEGAIPVFEAPKIDRQNITIAVSDRDAQPLVRIPGNMPAKAEKSGHCLTRFDVSPEGSPFNVDAYYCTDRVFSRDSIKTTSKFKYRPKIVDGRAVAMRGVETKITYRLTDERGRIIPE